MTTKATEKRLAALETTRRGPSTLIHCVQVGTGPALRSDGSECVQHHPRVFVIGGIDHDDKHG